MPEHPGIGLVRWGARLALLLLAAGLLLLLGEGRAGAAPSEPGPSTVSIAGPGGASVDAARALVSRTTRVVASRRHDAPARARGRSAIARGPAHRKLRATHAGSAIAAVARRVQPVAGRAGGPLELVKRGGAGRSVRQVVGATTRRVDVVLAPVEQTLEPLVGPVGDALKPAVQPVSDLLGPAARPRPGPSATSRPMRLSVTQGPAGGGPATTVGPRVAGAVGAAGPWVTAAAVGLAAIHGPPLSRSPGAATPAPPATVPGVPTSAQTTRDAPMGSLAAAVLLLFLLLLWSVPAGPGGERRRARPPLLFPA